MAGAAATSRFVGRGAELGCLEAAFGHAGEGGPMTVCVGGEAGVGKTRLVSRFGDQVRRQGGRVLVGGCVELGEACLPYAPVVEALRGLGRGLEPPALDELAGPGRPLLARLLPEFQREDEPGPGALAAGSSAQARLFEAFLTLLEHLADRSPTVLVTEDLHWADRSTLDLLAFLVRNLRAPLLLVLTYRSDELHRRHPLRPFLAGLDRSSRVERLDVGRFDRVGVTDLLAGILGARPDDELVEQIYRRSDGNAFFAEELLAASRQGDGRSLPPSLQNVLLSRVQDLAEDAQATLRIVAAASGRVGPELLGAVSELPEPDLLAVLRAAVAHQVLVPDPTTETYGFRHALTQEALYAELLPGERARLHAAFARVLTERPELAGPDGLAAPAQLAYHWISAHDPARALPAAVAAGLQSAAAYGFADAQRHFETALELWDQVTDAGARLDLDHAAVLQRAAESAYLAGDPKRAMTLTRAALAEVDAAQDPVRAGLLHGRLGGYLRATGGEGGFEHYEAAVRLVPTSPPLAERAQVLAAFGEALIGEGRYRESRDLCVEAIVVARQIGALAEEGDARRALGVDLAFLGELDAGVEQIGEARRIAETVGKVDEVARTFATLSGLLETFGELEAATAVALEGAELAARQGLGRWHSPFLTATAARALFALGRWDDADRLLQRAADGVSPELAATRVYIHTAYSRLDLARGRTGSAAQHLALAREAYALTVTQPWFATPLFTATAELAIADGRLAAADAAVADGLAVAGVDVNFGAPLYALGLRAAADRAELAHAERRDDEVLDARRVGGALAGELRTRLSPGGADAPVPPRTDAYAVLGEAELARLEGHSDPYQWAAAGKSWERLGQPYPAAYARWREAEALLLSGVVRDQVESSLRAAHATASELGAAPLRAEIEALARRGRLTLGPDPSTVPPSAPSPPTPLDRLGLTAREQEVLALVALGRTNRQIAETLFISPKTATVHVSNILGKLGVRSRVEAATIAHRIGTVQPGS
jgi:DNA-binding CsgD family transcriptional regulator/tetratricopeptide (TPR) repeat protein